MPIEQDEQLRSICFYERVQKQDLLRETVHLLLEKGRDDSLPDEGFHGLGSGRKKKHLGALSRPEFRVCQTIGIAQGAANRSALTQPQTETTPKTGEA